MSLNDRIRNHTAVGCVSLSNLVPHALENVRQPGEQPTIKQIKLLFFSAIESFSYTRLNRKSRTWIESPPRPLLAKSLQVFARISVQPVRLSIQLA